MNRQTEIFLIVWHTGTLNTPLLVPAFSLMVVLLLRQRRKLDTFPIARDPLTLYKGTSPTCVCGRQSSSVFSHSGPLNLGTLDMCHGWTTKYRVKPLMMSTTCAHVPTASTCIKLFHILDILIWAIGVFKSWEGTAYRNERKRGRTPLNQNNCHGGWWDTIDSCSPSRVLAPPYKSPWSSEDSLRPSPGRFLTFFVAHWVKLSPSSSTVTGSCLLTFPRFPQGKMRTKKIV